MGRIVVDIANAVAAVTISAPPMNAIDTAMRGDLAARLDDLAEGVRSFLERRSPQFRDGIDRDG